MARGRDDILPKNKPDWWPQTVDIAYALGLLTRLPVAVDARQAAVRGAGAAWAYPVVGLGLGLMFLVTAGAAAWVGLPPLVTAMGAVAVVMCLTGALHEDGFADVLDGFWGGVDRARRLAIMKDSHIGVYGVLGLGTVLILKTTLYAEILSQGPAAAVGLFALSRALMVGMMHTLPPARDTGLSQSVGRPVRETTLIALGVGGVLAVITLPLWAVAAMFGTAVGLGAIAQNKIGGQTGDVLGAAQVTTEVAGAICVVAIWF